MSYQQAKRQELSKDPIFSGGYVDNLEDNDKSGNQANYLRNVRIKGASLTVRPGYNKYKDLSSLPISIGNYSNKVVIRTNAGTDEKLIVLSEDRSIENITTTNISSDNYMHFTSAGDSLYCMNGSDILTKLTGTTHTAVSDGLSTPFKPSFSVVFNSSHFASGWSDNPTVVYKSVGDNFDDFSNTGSDQYTFPEEITGLAVSQHSLFYFTKNTITATSRSDVTETGGQFSYITTPLTTKEGATNNRTIVQAGNDLYYLTPSNKIMKVIRGSNVEGFETFDISHRKYNGIDNFMQSLNPSQDNSFGYYDSINNRVLRHFQEYGETVPTIILVYDRNLDIFLIDNNKYYTDVIVYNDILLASSRYENKILQEEQGNTDNGQAILAEYRTKKYSITGETMKKILRETRTAYDITTPGKFTQELRIDGGLYDSKTIEQEAISDGGLGTTPIATVPIGQSDGVDNEYISDYLNRTPGHLNKRFLTMQTRRTTDKLGGNFKIKTFQAKIETLDPKVTNL